MKKKAVFNWSGGKDSALGLYKVLQSDEYEIISLLTTINGENGGSSMHQIPEDLIQAQADNIGIPLYKVVLKSKGMTEYESEMKKAVEYFKDKGVNSFIFGDIFLSDVKEYREKQLSPYKIKVIEPLWRMNPKDVIKEFLDVGFKTKIVITQADKLDITFAGKDLDDKLLKSFPENIDCCGENGEFHTFVYDGPIFKKQLQFNLSEPQLITYEIKEDNQTQIFSYWSVKITKASI